MINKMNKKYMAFLILAVVFCLAGAPLLGSAAGGYTKASYDAVSQSIVISGDGVLNEGDAILVHVAKFGTGLSQSSLPVISDMFIAGSNGYLEDKIILPDTFENGKYTVHVMASSSDASIKTDLLICMEDSIATANALAKINNAKTKSEFKKAIEDGGYDLAVDSSAEADFDSVIDVMYGVYVSEGELTFDELSKAADFGRAFVMLKTGCDVDSVMKMYASCFDTSYREYSSLDAQMKSELDSLIQGMDFSRGFVDYASIAQVATVRSCDGYGLMRDYILANTDVFNININGDYGNLSVNNKAKVFKNMYEYRGSFKLLSDVEKAFDAEVRNVKKLSSQSTSFGGGSSSSGKTSYSEPIPPAPAEKASYTDIASHFAKEHIEELSSKGVINGFADGTFRPDEYVTRAQASKIIALAFSFKTGNESEFADVKKDSWHYPFVSALSSSNIVRGDGVNFRPDDFITREDAAVIIARALSFAGKECKGEYSFSDASHISDYALGSVNALASNGFLKGDGINFMPKNNITRGELATIIGRLTKANK